jgi:hypothetical protein
MRIRIRIPNRYRLLGGQSGQVEVETAIVMPAVIFLLLGLMQLGMLHQARLITEYAAYRAVRTGVVRNANVQDMETAALAAALPILSRSAGDSEVLDRTGTPADWSSKWQRPGFGSFLGIGLLGNQMTDAPLKYTEVTICGPLQRDVSGKTYSAGGDDYVPFDDPTVAGNGLTTKLRIELKVNYRLVIPFADWVIYRMSRGRNLIKELRLQSHQNLIDVPDMDMQGIAAMMGVHTIPIRAQYSMKMHSDMHKASLPTENNCTAGGGADD